MVSSFRYTSTTISFASTPSAANERTSTIVITTGAALTIFCCTLPQTITEVHSYILSTRRLHPRRGFSTVTHIGGCTCASPDSAETSRLANIRFTIAVIKALCSAAVPHHCTLSLRLAFERALTILWLNGDTSTSEGHTTSLKLADLTVRTTFMWIGFTTVSTKQHQTECKGVDAIQGPLLCPTSCDGFMERELTRKRGGVGISGRGRCLCSHSASQAAQPRYKIPT